MTLVLLLSACKTKKVVTYEGPPPERTNAELFDALKKHNYTFDWYAAEAGMSIKTPYEGISGKSYIRMKSDSVIWSVVKKLSVEAGRTLITPDSYAAINRIEGNYQEGRTQQALDKFGISLDFYDLQQAIFGNVILPDSAATEISVEGYQYVMKAVDRDLQLIYFVNGHTLELDKAQITDYRGRKITIEYSDYRKVDPGVELAFHRIISTPYNDEGDAEIIMKMKKIELDVKKSTKFSIPSHYDRVY